MRLIWTKFALDDLKAIRAYIARDSAHYAGITMQRIANAVKTLKKFPELGPIVPIVDRNAVRERIVYNYRVLYTLEKNHIVILAVLHASRDINSITLPERN
jgi:toxin ParE1/3/4